MMRYSVNGLKKGRLLENMFVTDEIEEAIKQCQAIATFQDIDSLSIYDRQIQDVVKFYKVSK